MIYAHNSKTDEVNFLRFCTFFVSGIISHDCCKITVSAQIASLLFLFEKIAIMLIFFINKKKKRKKISWDFLSFEKFKIGRKIEPRDKKT